MMEQIESMIEDAKQVDGIEIATDERARVRVSAAGYYDIQCKTGDGKWQTLLHASDQDDIVRRWIEYRSMSEQYARRRAANAPWAEMIEQIYVAPAELEPHPDAQAYGADDDDRAALDTSTGDVGILEPLTCERADDGRLLVIDGCGRLAKAVKAGLDRVPVQIVVLHGGLDARRFAAHKNAMGRKRSSGSRVLTYLMAHEQKVLEAAEAAEDPQERARAGGKASGRWGKNNHSVPNGTESFSGADIAKRLAVHKRDVLAGIDLLRASRRGEMPVSDGAKRKSWAEADERQLEATERALHGVLMGRLPVTRWLPAATGRVATADRGKAETCLPDLADRALASLRTVFTSWYDMTLVERVKATEFFEQVMAGCPEELLVCVPQPKSAEKGGRRI